MAGRFIKLYDKMLQWEWFDCPNTLSLFIYLLLKANYKDDVFQGKLIRRGQLVTSLPKLCQATGQTNRQVRDSLKHLEMTGEVTGYSTNRYRIITVVKYDQYQSNDRQDDRQNDRQNGRQMTDKASGKTAASIEYIELQNNRIIENSPTESLVQDRFDQFWDEYPRKEAKKNALVAWKKAKVTDELFSAIMASLHKWLESDQWSRDGGRYIPLPASWLNGKRWEDEVKPKVDVPRQAPAPIRVMPANNFEQRDYSNVDDELMDQLARDMAEFKRTGDA